MKRFLTLALGIVIGLFAVALLAGCGAKDDARSAMKQGDDMVVVIEKNSKTLVAEMDKTFSNLYQQINSGKTPDANEYNKSAKEITALANQMLNKASLVKAEYKKILPLKGVPDYVKYAQDKIKVIDLNVQGLKQLQNFLIEGNKRLAAQPFDPVGFQVAVVQYSDTLKKLGQESGKLQKQAEGLKEQKKL